MGILNHGFPTKSISMVENLASTVLAISFLTMSVLAIVELGGIHYLGRPLLA